MATSTDNPLLGSCVYFHTPTPLAKETFLYPLCLGHFFCDENYQVSRSSFDSFLLMYIIKGQGYINITNSKSQFTEHQLILLDCYQPHSYGALNNLEFYWLHFDGPGARQYYQFLTASGNSIFSLAAEHIQKLEHIFSILMGGCSGACFLKEIQFGKYITDILTLSALAPEENAMGETLLDMPEGTASACGQAAAFIQRHFMEPLTIQEVAGYVSLSPFYFIRRFKELFLLTPHQYLLNVRLDSARFYLRTTNKTVKDIAFSCGFQSENNFCIAFKKQVGMTPTRYRSLD